MANPGDVGTFDLWISNRLAFQTATPKADSTGDFDLWITNRLSWHEYQAAEVAGETLSIAIVPADSAYDINAPRVTG